MTQFWSFFLRQSAPHKTMDSSNVVSSTVTELRRKRDAIRIDMEQVVRTMQLLEQDIETLGGWEPIPNFWRPEVGDLESTFPLTYVGGMGEVPAFRP